MRIKNNERGGALLSVMLLIIVFTVLGMGLLAMNINASKQLNTKEEKIQARHLAEMGILHYKADIKDMMVSHNNQLNNLRMTTKNREELERKVKVKNKEFCIALGNKSSTNVQGLGYSVNLAETIGVDTYGCQNDSEIVLLATSIGIGESGGESEIRAALTIKVPDVDIIIVRGNSEEGTEDSNGLNNMPPLKPIHDVEETYGKLFVENAPKYYEKNIFISDGVDNKGNKIDGELSTKNGNSNDGTNAIFLKDLFIEGKLSFNTHGCIAVHGDFTATQSIELKNKAYLYVYGDANLSTSIEMHKNHADIFVSGNVYIDGQLQNPKPTDYKVVPKSHSCSIPGPGDSGTPNQPIYLTSEWVLEEKIEATYK